MTCRLLDVDVDRGGYHPAAALAASGATAGLDPFDELDRLA